MSIVFLDSETLGVEIDSPIWEIAAVRRNDDGTETTLHIFIDHDPEPWISNPDFPDSFKDDYRKRYNPLKSFMPSDAAELLKNFLAGRPHIVGAVPNFDTERIAHQILRPNTKRLWADGAYRELWNYHLCDVENLVVGYLHGQIADWRDDDSGACASIQQLLTPPWNSNELSRAIGVEPDQFDRHTALGDVRWVIAQWDAITGGKVDGVAMRRENQRVECADCEGNGVNCAAHGGGLARAIGEEYRTSRLVVTVYTRPACPGCNATKKQLTRLDIPFTEQPIPDGDEQLSAAFAELGCGTAPVVCASINGEELTWDGYRPDRINALKAAS